jgi:hypothetical protein
MIHRFQNKKETENQMTLLKVGGDTALGTSKAKTHESLQFKTHESLQFKTHESLQFTQNMEQLDKGRNQQIQHTATTVFRSLTL